MQISARADSIFISLSKLGAGLKILPPQVTVAPITNDLAGSANWGSSELRFDELRSFTLANLELERADSNTLISTGMLDLSSECRLVVRDVWTVCQQIECRRRIEVFGSFPGGYATRILAARTGLDGDPVAGSWEGAEVFAPGATLGDGGPLRPWNFTVPAVDVRAEAWIRQDRLSSPGVSYRFADGFTLSLASLSQTGMTSILDGAAVARSDADSYLLDANLDLISFGASNRGHEAVVGFAYPAYESAPTYSTTAQGLPFFGVDGRNIMLHPLDSGVTEFSVGLELSHTDDAYQALHEERLRWWRRLDPKVPASVPQDYVRQVGSVLFNQVRSVETPIGVLTGVGLESDPRTGTPLPGSNAAVMGFVGANTDVAWCLFRLADFMASTDAEPAWHWQKSELDPEALRHAAQAIVESFVTLPLNPPAGEGFDLNTGEWATYRDIEGIRAVYLRAVSEGCLAVLHCAEYMAEMGQERPAWFSWVADGAHWIRCQQRPDGSLPRAWEAGTGRVLEASGTASATSLNFLLAFAKHDARFLTDALRVGAYVWGTVEHTLNYAGGTLDNPDVVDKEAAILASEGFLALAEATGDDRWLHRAVQAGRVAESWVHLQDIPMPYDAAAGQTHWTPGDSIVGSQLITSGVTMSDGFLQVNAAQFCKLANATGDEWFTRVAQLVYHGPKQAIATPEELHGLAGAGWQQEHWGFGPVRGCGLNRYWLPWAGVSVLAGFFKLLDLGAAGRDILGLR